MYLSTIPRVDPAAEPGAQPAFLSTQGAGPATVPGARQPVRLSPAMVADLARFQRGPGGCVILAVLASCVRHSQPVQFKLGHDQREHDFAVYPRERLFRCEIDLCGLAPPELSALRLTELVPEPPPMPAPGAATDRRSGYGPLGTLLWRLAKHGPTGELLPEIAGPVRYRLAPGAPLENWSIHMDFQPLLASMRKRPASAAELARQTPLPRQRLNRLLNALYLQSALIVVQGK